jgi:hypothetical protein
LSARKVVSKDQPPGRKTVVLHGFLQIPGRGIDHSAGKFIAGLFSYPFTIPKPVLKAHKIMAIKDNGDTQPGFDDFGTQDIRLIMVVDQIYFLCDYQLSDPGQKAKTAVKAVKAGIEFVSPAITLIRRLVPVQQMHFHTHLLQSLSILDVANAG